MPYIPKDERLVVDSDIDKLIENIQCLASPTTIPGELELRNLDGVLNYTITRLLQGVLKLIDEPKYTKFNTALGILEGVKLELYRRQVAPYEDKKIAENGDVE